MSPPTPYTSNMNPIAGNQGYERGTRTTAEDNTQPRFELFLLGDGEKKVTEEADTRTLGICFRPRYLTSTAFICPNKDLNCP